MLSTKASLCSRLHPFIPSAFIFTDPVFVNNLRPADNGMDPACLLSTFFLSLFYAIPFQNAASQPEVLSCHYAGLYSAFSAYTDLGNHKLALSLKYAICFTKHFTG